MSKPRAGAPLLSRTVPALLALSLAAEGSVAATFTLSPSSVPADYAGTLQLDVTGLQAGSWVRFESYLDVDGSGSVSPGDLYVHSIRVTDGSLRRIGGVRVLGEAGDEDEAADGKVRLILRYPWLAEVHRAQAPYLVVATSNSPGFTPLLATFQVTPLAVPQGVQGDVTSGGLPVPHALVVLDGSVSGGEGFTIGLADGLGHYRVPAPAGTYALLAVATGMVFDVPAPVTVTTGAFLYRDLAMRLADRTISGSVVDPGLGTGILGMQLVASASANPDEGPGTMMVGASGPDGQFSLPVVAGTWRIEGFEAGARIRGRLYPRMVVVDASAGSVQGFQIAMPRGESLVYGTTTDGTSPLAGMRVFTQQANLEADCLSDDAGNYACVANPGPWGVTVDEDQAAARGFLKPGWVQVDLASGEARRVDLVYTRVGARLRGSVTSGGAPVAGVTVVACRADDPVTPCASDLTDGDGRFDLGVAAGTWFVNVAADDVARLGLLGTRREVPVGEDEIVDGLALPLLAPSAHVTGTVRRADSAPVQAIHVYGQLLAGGGSYEAAAITDVNGAYALHVVPGAWDVTLSCTDLSWFGFQCVDWQHVAVTDHDEALDWTLAPLACWGDCDGSLAVAVQEIDTLILIALGSAPLEACSAGDASSDGSITVSDIVRAVQRMRGGCAPG